MNLSTKFSPGYINNCFNVWYAAGKPRLAKFKSMVPLDPLTNSRPQPSAIKNWMKHDEWLAKEQEQDAEVEKFMREKRLTVTVEMMERHAETAREMQKIAIMWLRDNEDNLTPGTAVKLLVDGVNMEQSTASIPDMLLKMRDMNDEKLLEEIAQSIVETPSEINAN